MTAAAFSIDDNDTVIQYTSTGESAFAYDFPILAADEIRVSVDQADLVYGTDFTLSGVGDEGGGTVTITAGTTAGEKVTIWQDMPIERATGFSDGAATILSADLNTEFVRLLRVAQQLRRDIENCLRLPPDDPTSGVAMELGIPSARRGKYLTFADTDAAPPEFASLADASLVTLSQSVIGGLVNPQAAAESSAGVTPTNSQYPGKPLIDATRYHSGTIGNSTDDDNAVDALISVIKAGGGTGIIPPDFNSSMAIPALGLGNDESGAIIDLRFDNPNSGNNYFGSLDIYVEGRDSSGNYASEVQIFGKQNPAFVVNTLSDGTANGYDTANNGSSFVHRAGSSGKWQYVYDPLFKGYDSWAMASYASGSGKYVMWASIDNNDDPRITLCPSNLVVASGNVSGATNASPIEITTDADHGLAGINQPVTIADVEGNTAANGSWEVTVTGSDTFTLNGSEGNGTYTTAGSWSSQTNHSRGMLNVPKVQGGTIGIVNEGSLFSTLAHGNAPVVAQSQTPDTNLHARPVIYDNAGNQQVSGTPGTGVAKLIMGEVALVAGAATVNLTSSSAFSGTNNYRVFLSPNAGASAATATRVSAAQFTIAGTGTDTISYFCLGY